MSSRWGDGSDTGNYSVLATRNFRLYELLQVEM